MSISSNGVDRTQEVVAERYRVEGLLGQGGIGVVHRVWDELRQAHVALKRLHGNGLKHQGLFEREFFTLAQLSHPCIIKVFDYGVADGTPYYTMELLQGQDLHSAAERNKLNWRDACGVVRDVASALALLHSRRLLHRDVSSRNVWRCNDDRTKLIDFGGLAPMGPADQLVGTPPFLAPEATHGQPLDGRSDLYSLGALAYFLLVGQHAYAARSIHDLRLLWQQRPARPHVRVPELSRELSDLVMMLLSLDPRGRPASASEIVERLSVIAELPHDDSQQTAQAYLTTPNVVGREAHRLAFRKSVLRALRGRGNAALVAAAPGAGRSRLLSSFVLEAKLIGLVAVQVSGEAAALCGRTLLAELAAGLLSATPEATRAAGELGPVLARLSDDVREALGVDDEASAAAVASASPIIPAFVEWIGRICRRTALLIAVDDVHHADEAGQSALGQLVGLAPRRRLALCLSADAAALRDARPALQLLSDGCETIDLPPLEPDDLAALLGSLLGNVPHLDSAVEWLQEVTQGNPGRCMQYVQYLVEHGVVHYSAGAWTLPERLRDHPLPADLDALLDARVARLSDDARRLALGLCLTHDDTRPDWQPQTQLRSEHFGMLLGIDDRSRVFAAVGELVGAGMLAERAGQYALAQRAMIDALRRCTSDGELRAMHLRLSRVLLEGRYNDPHLAILHMQRGGDDAAALASARELTIGRSGNNHDWLQTRITISILTAERMLRYLQEQGGASVVDEVRIRGWLLLSSTVNDWSLSRYGAAQLRQLEHDTGLADWDQTDPDLPPVERLFACFGKAQARHDATPEAARGLAPGEAVRELASCVMTLGSSCASAFAVDALSSLPGKLLPLRPLSPAIEVLAQINEYTVERAQGRDTDRFADLIAGLDAAAQLSQVIRQGATVVLIFQHAVHAARLGRSDAEAIARQIDERFHPGAWMVDYACWLGAGFLGDARTAARHQRIALSTVDDDVWRRRALLHVEVELYVLTGDVRGLERVEPAIAMLAERFAGWRPMLHHARAELHRMRRELAGARSELEQALALAPAGRHAAYTLASPAYAEVLLELGELDELREHVHAAIEACRTEKLRSTCIVGNARALALGESRAGNHDAATAALSLALQTAREAAMGGLRLAVLHEARARIAIAAEDREAVNEAMGSLRDLVMDGGMPSWLGRYEALFSDAGLDASEGLGLRRGAYDSGVEHTVAQLTETLGKCNDDAQRALVVLEALVTETGAVGGHLYFVADSKPTLVASLSDGHPGEDLSRFVEQYLEAESNGTQTATVTEFDEALLGGSATATLEGRTYVPVLLVSYDLTDDPLGLAMLEAGAQPCTSPDYTFVRALCRVLQQRAA